MTPRNPRAHGPTSRAHLACAALLAALAALLVAPSSGPHLERASGRVEIGSGEPPVWRLARAGDPLEPGDAVRTGRDGRAELALASGSVRLYGDSLLRLPAASAEARPVDAVELDSGSSLFDVLHRGSHLFEVRTPEVVVSIKGTRFLVVEGERAEVAVFRGVVGLRREQEPARELLVREGFAAVGDSGRPFELVWTGAPDPWDTWFDGGSPPRAPEAAAEDALHRALGVEAAKAAAQAESRREAVEQAVERHPKLAERVAEIVEDGQASEGGGPAAPDPITDDKSDGRRDDVSEKYVEALLNGGPGNSGQGGGQGGGGGSGPSFDVDTEDDAVIVSSGGQSWTLSEDQLESVVEGTTTLPQPLVDAVAGQGGNVNQLAQHLLSLLH